MHAPSSSHLGLALETRGHLGECFLYPLEGFGVILDQLGKNLY
jgi:hypothetical protein